MKVVPGALVDFFSDGKIVAGVVLLDEKGRLRVVTESGREERIAPGRILAAYEGSPKLAATSGKPEPAKVEMAHKLAAAHARAAQELRGGLDVGLVWDIIVDEGGGERGLESLAELATGHRTAVTTAAMLRELLAEKVHFSRRADLWEPRTREAVKEILKQRERERRRAEQRTRFLEKLRAAVSARARFEPSGEEEETRLLAALEELAIQGSQASPASREAEALLGEMEVHGENPAEKAYRVLWALGRFTEDENLFIRKYGLHVDFPPEADDAARRAIEGAAERLAGEVAEGGRRDLTSVEMFSVDDELTSEIDDALSVEPLPGGRFHVGIHIADPGFLVPSGSEIDRIAESRAVTFYLPERRVLMLPSLISEQAASLLPSGPRPALTFSVTLSETGSILGWEIFPSVIRSRARVTYEEADQAVRLHEGNMGGSLPASRQE